MLTGMIALAAAVVIHPAGCRLSGPGLERWQQTGADSLSASTSAQQTGEVRMSCRVRVPPGGNAVTVGFDHVWISFVTAGSKEPGSGLILQIGDNCRAEVIRVAGEDWIESVSRAWSAAVPAGTRTIELTVILKDASRQVPVRIDLRGLRLRPGRHERAEDCPAR